MIFHFTIVKSQGSKKPFKTEKEVFLSVEEEALDQEG